VLSLWRCVVFLSKCDPRIWRRNISCECTSSIMHCVRVLCACAHLHVCAHSLAQKNELTNTHRTTDSWPRSAASMSGETPVSSAWDATRSATAASPPLSRLARMIEATPSALPSPTAAASSACCPSAQPDAGPLPSMMCVQRLLQGFSLSDQTLRCTPTGAEASWCSMHALDHLLLTLRACMLRQRAYKRRRRHALSVVGAAVCTCNRNSAIEVKSNKMCPAPCACTRPQRSVC
jgi:hypothetical protein